MSEPLTDGLLVLRARFGFSGSSLTLGAVGENCMRCDSATILSYLIGLGLTLDIDDDGTLQPLTDGLLILRFLFGFGGTTLTEERWIRTAVAATRLPSCLTSRRWTERRSPTP